MKRCGWGKEPRISAAASSEVPPLTGSRRATPGSDSRHRPRSSSRIASSATSGSALAKSPPSRRIDGQHAVRLRADAQGRQRRPATHEIDEEIPDAAALRLWHDRRPLLGRQQIVEIAAPGHRPERAVHRRHRRILVDAGIGDAPQHRLLARGRARG